MAIQVNEAVCVHEAVVLWLIMRGATRRQRLGHPLVDTFTRVATLRDQHLHGLAGVAHSLWGEGAKLFVRAQHDRTMVVDHNGMEAQTAACPTAYD